MLHPSFCLDPLFFVSYPPVSLFIDVVPCFKASSHHVSASNGNGEAGIDAEKFDFFSHQSRINPFRLFIDVVIFGGSSHSGVNESRNRCGEGQGGVLK